MSWEDEATLSLRFAIGDFTAPYAYCDSRLFDLFMYGAKLTTLEISYPEEYVVNISNATISPNPASDDPIITLGTLKAAYIIANSEYKAKAAGAVSITDGPSTISLTATAGAFAERVKQLGKDYEKAKLQYTIGYGLGMKVVIGPTTNSNSQVAGFYHQQSLYGHYNQSDRR